MSLAISEASNSSCNTRCRMKLFSACCICSVYLSTMLLAQVGAVKALQQVESAHLSPDKAHLVVGGKDMWAYMLDFPTGKPVMVRLFCGLCVLAARAVMRMSATWCSHGLDNPANMHVQWLMHTRMLEL